MGTYSLSIPSVPRGPRVTSIHLHSPVRWSIHFSHGADEEVGGSILNFPAYKVPACSTKPYSMVSTRQDFKKKKKKVSSFKASNTFRMSVKISHVLAKQDTVVPGRVARRAWFPASYQGHFLGSPSISLGSGFFLQRKCDILRWNKISGRNIRSIDIFSYF